MLRSQFLLAVGMSTTLAMVGCPAKAEEANVQQLKQEIQDLERRQKDEAAALQSKLKALQQQVDANQAQETAVRAWELQTSGTDSANRPPLGKHTGIRLTFGGYIEMAGIYRNKDEATDIGTAFQKIPFENSDAAHISELRGSARQSRVQGLAEGNIDEHQILAAFIAADFLGAAPTSNSNESNSYTPRLREAYATYDDTLGGWHVLAGQSWSMVTMFKDGLIARQENIPLTIDAQYAPGFDWLRNPEIRIVKDWDKKVWLGVEAASPQAIAGGTAPLPAGSVVTGLACQSQLNNALLNSGSAQSCSLDFMPDVTVKLAVDPGWGHYEVFGLARGFRDRSEVSHSNDRAYGFSGGADVILPVFGPALQLQGNVLAGHGIGRYTSSQLADYTFNADGSVAPLAGVSFMVGAVSKAIKGVDIYAYYGQDKLLSHFADLSGYGNPAVLDNSGCDAVPGTGVCTGPGQLSSVWQVTGGFWQRLYDGDKGIVQWGPQFSYTVDNAGLSNKGGSPQASLETAMVSFRYYPKFGTLVGSTP